MKIAAAAAHAAAAAAIVASDPGEGKRLKRLETNRRSAQQSRLRRKERCMDLERRTSTLENENIMLKDTIKRLKITVVDLNARLGAAGLTGLSGSDGGMVSSSAEAALQLDMTASMPPPPAIKIDDSVVKLSPDPSPSAATAAAAASKSSLSDFTVGQNFPVSSPAFNGQASVTPDSQASRRLSAGSVGSALQRLLPGCSPQPLPSRSSQSQGLGGALASLSGVGGSTAAVPTADAGVSASHTSVMQSSPSSQPMVDALSSLRANPLSSLMTL